MRNFSKVIIVGLSFATQLGWLDSPEARSSKSLQGMLIARGECNPLASSWTPSYANIVSYLPLSAGTGSIANNASIAAQVGTAGTMSNANSSTSPTTGYVSGHINNAVQFDGTDDSVILPNTLLQSLTVLSISVWFKTSSASGAILAYQNAAIPSVPTNYVPVLYIAAEGNLRAQMWYGTVGPIATAGTVTDGNWHHVLLSVSGSSQTLYFDGASVGSVAGTINNLDMAYNQIGRAWAASWPSGGTGWLYFNGSIEEFAVWNVALTASDAQTIYQKQSCALR